MKPLIIHHEGCSDGICGALIIWLGLGKQAEVRAAQYDGEPPTDDEVTDRDVWMVDFSYPREVLEHINELANKLVVLDHHETAQANCEGLDFTTFDMDKSGATLAYDYMEANGSLDKYAGDFKNSLKKLADYVEDRDLWKWNLANSKEFNNWISSYPRELKVWYAILSKLSHGPANWDTAFASGRAITRQNDKLAKSMIEKAWKGTYTPPDSNKLLTALITTAPILQSEVAGELGQQADFGVAWSQNNDRTYLYSLRSRDDRANVADIAKNFGGGGHAASSGFSSNFGPTDLFEPVDD